MALNVSPPAFAVWGLPQHVILICITKTFVLWFESSNTIHFWIAFDATEKDSALYKSYPDKSCVCIATE